MSPETNKRKNNNKTIKASKTPPPKHYPPAPTRKTATKSKNSSVFRTTNKSNKGNHPKGKNNM